MSIPDYLERSTENRLRRLEENVSKIRKQYEQGDFRAALAWCEPAASSLIFVVNDLKDCQHTSTEVSQ